MARSTVTQEAIRALLDYNPDSGKFYWRPRPVSIFKTTHHMSAQQICDAWNKQYSGQEAGSQRQSDGYVKICVHGYLFYAHRLAFLWMEGEIPVVVDHANMDTNDNRWTNLRKATVSQNLMNQPKRVYEHASSSHKGVSYWPERGKWYARIQIGRKRKHLGYFSSEQEAAAAYAKSASELHAEFARVE